MTTLARFVLIEFAVDLALLGLILAAHWWRRNDPCTCGCGALNDYDGGDVYDQELDTPDWVAWRRQVTGGELL